MAASHSDTPNHLWSKAPTDEVKPPLMVVRLGGMKWDVVATFLLTSSSHSSSVLLLPGVRLRDLEDN